MEYHQSSQIPTLSYIENEDHPVFGTLVEQILHLLNSKLVFSDVIIHQNSPLMLRQPKGLVAVTDSPITKEELEEFFDVIEPNWSERIQERAFDRSIDLHTARIRANCFSFQGKKRLGCVIRRFPKEPLLLAELGLHTDEQEFARMTSGLVLIIGDTCQGKSTTIASILDEINRQRSGHIITIEDPVETLIPQRKCIITQREVGVDGDVDSYYLGALDALRERPDAGAGDPARALHRTGPAEDAAPARQFRRPGPGPGPRPARRAVPGAAAVQAGQPLPPGHRVPEHQPGGGRDDRKGRPRRDPQPHEHRPRAGLPHDEQRAGRLAGIAQGGCQRCPGRDHGPDRVCGDGVGIRLKLS
jgi:hypothetical protein